MNTQIQINSSIQQNNDNTSITCTSYKRTITKVAKVSGVIVLSSGLASVLGLVVGSNYAIYHGIECKDISIYSSIITAALVSAVQNIMSYYVQVADENARFQG